MAGEQRLLIDELKRELARIRRRNPDYSLRSFARHLNVSAAGLSEILRNKRPVGLRIGQKMLARLPTDASLKEKILRELKSQKGAAEVSRRSLSQDEFRLISDWTCFAILSLLETDSSLENMTSRFACRLNLKPARVRADLSRLVRLGIVRAEGGRMVRIVESLTTTHDVPNEALRECHSQYLELARRSMFEQPSAERDITGITMMVDPKKISKAKEKLKKFRRELCAFLERGHRSRVYRLNLQLFALSDISSPKKKETSHEI